MAFEGLSSKLQNIFRKLGGKGKLTEKEVKEAMREIKLALLEADVNFSVVKSFINTVSARAVGSDVLQSLTPSQQIIKIVNEELTQLIGGSVVKVEFGPRKPSVFLLAGLQGAGKTTMAGKLAAYLAKTQGKKPLLVACDIYRPAAITQLQVVGEKVNVPVFERGTQDPVKTAKEAIEYASRNFYDLVIIDTAGRLHIDENMMDEIAAEIELSAKPTAPPQEPTSSPVKESGEYSSRDEVALYIHLFGHLPANFITKKQARELGWQGGGLQDFAPGCSIGGDRFGNYEGLLPQAEGRFYTECDIDTCGAPSRGAKRIVFSNDGLIFYTDDHYQSFIKLYDADN